MEGSGEGIVREFEINMYVHTVIFKIDNQQRSTVQHRELCSMLYNNLSGKSIWERIDACIGITELLCNTPETITTRLINYAVLCLVAQTCLTLCKTMDCGPPGSSVDGDSLRKNMGMGCHALLQGIFPIQGSNPVSQIAGRFCAIWGTREAPEYWNR